MMKVLQFFKDIFLYKDLLYYLTSKELKLKYKYSVLGIVWSLVNPLMMIVIYTIAFKLILRIDIENYSILVFTGLLPWIFFQTTVSQSASSIIGNSSLIGKVYFPRSILPLSLVISNYINFLFTLIVLFAAILFFKIKLTWSLMLLPVFLLLLLIFVLGIALLISSTTTKFRDIAYLTEIFFTAWFYLTPIIYPFSMVPDNLKLLIFFNPFTSVVESFRMILLEGKVPDLLTLSLFGSFSILFFLIGVFIFKSREKFFVDEI
jgi:lipopolysaccharide transport system permease protein